MPEVLKPLSAAKPYVASTLSSTKMKKAGATGEIDKGKLLAQMREKASRKLVMAPPGLKSIDESDKEVDNGTKATTQTNMDLETQTIKVVDQMSQASRPVTGMESNATCEPGRQQAEGEHKYGSQGIVQNMFKTDNKQANGSDVSIHHSGDLEGPMPPITSKEGKTSRALGQSAPTKPTQPSPPTVSGDHDELAMLRPQLLSPLDTYEMSDRENSGTDDSESEEEDDDENDEPKKKVSTSERIGRGNGTYGHITHSVDSNVFQSQIPDWAQKANLLPALERQFCEGEGRIDPDELFSEVQTCDLQAIFNAKRTRYLKRTSSGNWSRDRVTTAEKKTYKRTMGYSKER